MQHTPSRFLKVAKPAELHHAHPAFSRFMTEHPRISRFIAEHPKASRFVFRLAHHIPVLQPYVPLAPHVRSLYNSHACRPRWPRPGR